MYTRVRTQRQTVFGLLTTDGRRMFRQHDRFDMYTFARFPRAAVHRFGRICMTLDNAPLHHAKTIRQLVDMIGGLTLKFLPAATPEISAIEPYWKELKRRMFDVQHTSPAMLRRVIARYTRYAKPNLNVEKILHRII